MRVLTQAEIEDGIMRLSAELEDEVYRYAALSDDAAEAEAAYKGKHARAVVRLGAESGVKSTALERQARAELSAVEELRLYRIAEGRRSASKERLLSLRSRIDALRTLSANVRHAT